MLKYLDLTVGARGSPLSQVQVWEVEKELQTHHPEARFFPIWVKTRGDKDQKTGLREMEKSDFFTHELDAMQLKGVFRLTVHSAKDLPEPLPNGLEIIALTQGLSDRDALVLREGESLKPGAHIGTSSDRRIAAIKELGSDLKAVEIRGPIDVRLKALDEGRIDGLVVALCALQRLKQNHRNHILLEGAVAPMQGKLAVLALSSDEEMKELFHPLHHEAYSLSGQ
jgi:hydroxymethylbilane synthase